MTLALENGSVMTPDGSLTPATVLIAGEEIQGVGADLVVPADAERRDITGMTVLPGLIDVHTHITTYPGIERDPLARGALKASHRALRAVRAGVTSVRDLGSFRQIDVELRDAIARHEVIGPTMVCAGTFISMTGGHGHTRSREADGPDDVRKAAREQLRAGADVIKLMCSGGVIRLDESPSSTQFTPEEIRAGVEEATAAGKVAVAHAHPPQAIKNAVLAGVSSVEHASFLDDESAALMAERGTFMVPTFVVFRFIERSGANPDLARRAGHVLDLKRRSFECGVEAGVRWGVGTDCGAYSPVESLVDEIAYMVEELGLDAAEVLLAATGGNAELIGLRDRGRVVAGDRADLNIVAGNPVRDIHTLRDIKGTVLGGRYLDWQSDDARLAVPA